MEKKYAVMRVTNAGQDILIAQEVSISERKTLASARREVISAVQQRNATVAWIGWFDKIGKLKATIVQ